MHYSRIISLLVLLASYAAIAPAAIDQNGYVAQYECRADGAYCDVDVVGLTRQPCQQTITPGDDEATAESKVNSGSRFICVEPGDYDFTLNISVSGNSNEWKVLRYTRSGDTDDDPWEQSSHDRSKFNRLVLNGNFWIVHRLTFPSIDRPLHHRLYVNGSVRDVIISRVLVEGMSQGFSNAYTGIYVDCCSAKRITIQNSVVRNSWGKIGSEPHGITPLDGDDIRIVNNEIYDWSAHPIQMGRNGGDADMAGFVIENNDIYQTPKMYLANGRARAKNPLSLKAGGVPGNPGRVIHNRIWGARKSDTSVCCIDSDAGAAILISNTHDHILIQNNILFDSQRGFGFYNGDAHNISIIGNIFSGMRRFDSNDRSHAIETVGNAVESEFYLNSFIDNSDYGMSFGGGSIDIRCNTFVAGGARQGGTPGFDTTADHNAFYGTPSWSFNGTNTLKDMELYTRAGSTHYEVNSVVRWGNASSCTDKTDAPCFLYMTKNSGKTSASELRPCTSLGCTFNDGEIAMQAIRGPHEFYRKLRTAHESHVIPYARVYSDAPEAYACPADYAARPGIGINDPD